MLQQGGYTDMTLYLKLFLRLRQGISHPFLLETTMKNTLTKADLKNIRRRIEEIRDRQPIFKRIGRWCAKETTAIVSKEENDDSAYTFGNSQFGYEFDLNKQINIALASHQANVCRICYQEPINAQVAKVS